MEHHITPARSRIETIYSMLGGILYGAGLNFFIFPLGLYIGSVTGIAQMVQSIINSVGGLNLQMTGVLLFVINIPLLFLTYHVISKGFFYRTVWTLIAQSLAMELIPISSQPLISDPLTLCLLGGIVCGFGAGFSLAHEGSGGGLDILGVYLSLKYKRFSVGRASLLISGVVMLYVAFAFPVEILIYSVIFTIVYSLVLDQIHFQNIKVSALIVTEKQEMASFINQEVSRGVTIWEAWGVHTDRKKYMVLTIVDKNEFLRLKTKLTDLDPDLFMIDAERVNVTGAFDKRLV